MIDEGVKLSDERTRQLIKRLEEVYTESYKTAVKNNEKAIAKYASLTDEALKDLDDEAKKLKREAFAREIKRTEGLKNQIAAEIAQAGETAAQIIQGEITGIYGLNYDFAAFNIQQQAGLSLSFTQYDRNQLAVLVSEGQSPFTKIAYKNLGKDTAIVKRLQNQFIQGVMNGESQQKLIRHIRAVTGQSMRQAKRVAQTERNRVQSQGRNQAIHEAAEMGLGMQKQWVARLFNTRELHEKSHLEVVDEGEKFNNGLEFPGDPSGTAENVINCFCVLKPMVKSVSPALARHREKFKQQSFDEYRKKIEARQVRGNSEAARLAGSTEGDVINYKRFESGEASNDYFYGSEEYVKWKSGLTDKAYDIMDYTGEGYKEINNYLRDPEKREYIDIYGDKEHIQKTIESLDSSISSFTLNDDITVYRKVDSRVLDSMPANYRNDVKSLIGQPFTEDAYSSASTVPSAYSTRKDTIFEISVPSGQGRGAYINELSDYKDREYEFLLARDSKFIIRDATKKEGIYHVKMEMIGDG